MKPDYKDALLLALDRGIAKPNGKWAMYNALHLQGLEPDWQAVLNCEQALRPEFIKLERGGYSVAPKFDDGEKSSGAIIFLGRNRKVNEANIIRAWSACDEGAQIIVAGDKTAGIGSIRKWVSQKTEITDSFSKYHAVVFWFMKKGADWQASDLSKNVDGYHLAEGMFSSDGPDKGSLLLAEHFDKRLGGPVADLGAGWGYLSNELLKRTEKVTELALYEADFHSLEAARKNITAPKGLEISYHWCDIRTEFKKKPYQWVIMNPPFHTSRSADPELGKKFIQVAGSTLPSGGKLLMVANKNLPYEETLNKVFRHFKVLQERDGFKLIEAVK